MAKRVNSFWPKGANLFGFSTRFLFEIYGFDDMAVVDSSINFYDTYKLNPILGKDVVFLLDSTNTILSIGNIYRKPK